MLSLHVVKMNGGKTEKSGKKDEYRGHKVK